MNLNRLTEGLEILEILGETSLDINAIAYDSRKVTKASIFVCIKGFKTDGHDYAGQAVRNGAVALVVERLDDALLKLHQEEQVTLIHVVDGRVALSAIANAFYDSPSQKVKLVGVTGTNGKTSIAQMLTSMFEGLKHRCAVLGTIENRIVDKVYEAVVTTPESLELNQLFYEMKEASVDYCVMEVSSHALDLNRVAGLQFDYGLFTNLTKDHLDFHKDMKAYFEAKARLFNRTSKGNITNVDDPYGRELVLRKEEYNASMLTYGIDEEADLSAIDIRYKATGSEFTLKTPKWTLGVQIPIPGKIYIYNYLAAVSVLYLEGVDMETIAEATRFIKPIPGRLEPIASATGINVIVDFAHTPDSLDNVLRVARSFTKGRLITVFGCGGDRDRSKRPEMGKIALELSDFTFITSDNPRTEDPDAIIEEIIEGIKGTASTYTSEVDRRKAIGKAIAMAEPEDTVLIAGKGHETYQIIGTTKHDFDDRDIARSYLEA